MVLTCVDVVRSHLLEKVYDFILFYAFVIDCSVTVT